MKLPFLNRTNELERLRKAFSSQASTLVCLYGRRRCGKSRLLLEALKNKTHVYYVGDKTDRALQIGSLAGEVARLVEGFDQAKYEGWEQLLLRWWKDAPSGAVLAIDEFPYIAEGSPELPSILQKFVDLPSRKVRHIALCGSSQRMMHGLVLNGDAPLYGRANEIIKLFPLPLHYTIAAKIAATAQDAVQAYAVWGGVPRYWELAAGYESLSKAVDDLVLSPLGVLHNEPERLLSDEMQQTTRMASSIMALVGQGCNRTSEIAARLNMAATSLMRPLSLLADLGFVQREIPFGRSLRDTKRTLYKLADPFLRYWYRFVEPNRSLLEAGQIDTVKTIIRSDWNAYLGGVWEDLARTSVARAPLFKHKWLPASRWWGSVADRSQVEIDIVARSAEAKDLLLIGEAKLSASRQECEFLLDGLKKKTELIPEFKNMKKIYALWIMKNNHDLDWVIGVNTVVKAL